MRLHVLSDLHLEFAPFNGTPPDCDVVVLAGDISVGRQGRQWIPRQFRDVPVIYVLGNHEFYRHSLPDLTETLIRETTGSQIHLLENSAVEIDGYTFLGCTLWSDFKIIPEQTGLAQWEADRSMPDFELIHFSPENRILRPTDTLRLHEQSRAWLQSELDQRDPSRCIIVTHHAPAPKSIPPWHAGSLLNGAFVSDLTRSIVGKTPLWIHGHTHYNVNYAIGPTRVVANQRGYPDQLCRDFDPNLIIEI